jgi:hypothetical protein
MAGISPNTLNLNEGTSSVNSEGNASNNTGPMSSNPSPFTSAFGNDDMPVNTVTVGKTYGDNYTGGPVVLGPLSYDNNPEGRSSTTGETHNAKRRRETLARAYDYDTRHNYPTVTLYNYRNPGNPIKRNEQGNFYQDVPSVNGSIGGRNTNFDRFGNDRSAPGYDASTLPSLGESFGTFYNGLNTAIKTMPGAILSMDVNPPLGGKTAAELRAEVDAQILDKALRAESIAKANAAYAASQVPVSSSSGKSTSNALQKEMAKAATSYTNSQVDKFKSGGQFAGGF